ncbi:STAS domain-containing protein [Rhodoferax sp. AJA081-3]|uniref:STAS domain-containing protein n=1 Tax=Rhodoferax sp. AJA081-3 TaxID=2752316 RepID=UPI001AE0CC6E|nr:STAS domain-containing protein [Rhodoferax sp. AJA081-3]QTN28972.1 STAS domain-containing protein [Rhodoferax sp. AJA081-3]
MIPITGEMTIYRAAELKEQLLLALAQEPGTLVIDLSSVTEMDVAGLQVLIMAKQAAKAQNRELRLVAHSPAVLEVFEILNVAAFFGDQLVMAEGTT